MRLLTPLLLFSLLAPSLHAQLETALRLSDEGIGGLDADTPFDQAVVSRLFPLLDVNRAVRYTEDLSFPVLVVADEKGPLFTIYPVSSASVDEPIAILGILEVADRLRSDFAVDKDALFSQVYDPEVEPACTAGREERSGTVTCLAPGAENVHFVFTGSWNGPDGTVPEREILDRWRFVELVWLPGDIR
jgi:hypothetical protein